jgi:hypothetical protein
VSRVVRELGLAEDEFDHFIGLVAAERGEVDQEDALAQLVAQRVGHHRLARARGAYIIIY